MKLRTLLTASCLTAMLASCSNNDDTVNGTPAVAVYGKLTVEFDNTYGTDDFVMGQEYTTSSNENISATTIKYIVSNITLTQEDGTVFTYPKSDSYFIVNETKRTSLVLNLDNIPAANYSKISFGIGVDQEQFNLGASGQGNFLALAQTEQMLWSWSAGYKFIDFEGTYTSQTTADPSPFTVHTGQTGTDYNYISVNLNMPTAAIVSKTVTPAIHIKADLSKILDGATKIILTENDPELTGANIQSGPLLPVVTTNFSRGFSVSEVHNNAE